MARKPVVAVIGTGSEIEPAITNARRVGELIAEKGWVLISGGRDCGVMNAVSEGAKTVDGSLTIGIMPNAASSISQAVDVAIITDVNEARNNIIVLSAKVVIACGVDSPGTASEVALALKSKKHVILLGADEAAERFFRQIDEDRVYIAESPEDAIRIIMEHKFC